ncbi:hypothetical protein DsansV1_C10g0099851 [Dioscorea sansibarensis]
MFSFLSNLTDSNIALARSRIMDKVQSIQYPMFSTNSVIKSQSRSISSRALDLSEDSPIRSKSSRTRLAARRLRSTVQSSRTVSNSPATANLTISKTSSIPEKSKACGSNAAAAVWSNSFWLSTRSRPLGRPLCWHAARPAVVEAKEETCAQIEGHSSVSSVSLQSSAESLTSFSVSGDAKASALEMELGRIAYWMMLEPLEIDLGIEIKDLARLRTLDWGKWWSFGSFEMEVNARRIAIKRMKSSFQASYLVCRIWRECKRIPVSDKTRKADQLLLLLLVQKT